MKNYKPQTVHDFNLEIKVYEKYFKKYEKQIEALKATRVNYKEWELLKVEVYHIKEKLSTMYLEYLRLLNKSNKPKFTLIYQSKMNR